MRRHGLSMGLIAAGHVEPSFRRVRAYLAGQLVVDTTEARLVWEHTRYPAYYLPGADVRARLAATERRVDSELFGTGKVYDVAVDGGVAEAAAVRYVDAPDVRELIRFEWSALDWFEEDEPVYVHPRSPYTRVDVLNSSRRVEVRVAGVTVADSRQPRILLETGHPPRYYLPRTDVRMDLLRPSTTTSGCPYKGFAKYWHVVVDGVQHDDLVWTYPSPLPESQRIIGLACFYTERVELLVDGQPEWWIGWS